MNLAKARNHMIKRQLRTWDVLDTRVLAAIAAIPREDFVPNGYRKLAFADTCLPLAHEQFMMPPREEARLVQALALKATDNVLEIGTGSGYLTALLAKLSKRVLSVDIFPDFRGPAKKQHDKLGLNNIRREVGDAAHGWSENAPYDAIAITGSLPNKPTEFYQDLKIGGRLFAIIGEAPAMQATLITRISPTQWKEKVLYETVIPALIDKQAVNVFTF